MTKSEAVPSFNYSEKELSSIADLLRSDVRPGVSIGLIGDLGVGKTALVRAILRGFGVSNVPSPTFSLQNEYEISSRLTIEHWDIYRLSAAPEELLITASHNTARLIEWADRDQRLQAQLDYQWTILRGNDDNSRVLHREFKLK